jgi:pimeloyl-ACP methyl ester carboxylesterase
MSSGIPSLDALHRALIINGLRTSYIEAGDGPPLVLLHGGEFGGTAELGWERVFTDLTKRFRVVAPDHLGYGGSAKVVDFTDMRGSRIRHLASFVGVLGLEGAQFVGNSLGAILLLIDASSPRPRLPASRIVAICGGGEIQQNKHTDALFSYNGEFESMRRLVAALFHDQKWPDDDNYVRRRHMASILPGAWEAVAAARYRRPGGPPLPPREKPDLENIRVPALFIEGEHDKLLPWGWSGALAARVRDAEYARVRDAGHCPQIEQPEATMRLLLEFLI